MRSKRHTLFLPSLVVFVAVMVIVVSSFFVSLRSLEQERRGVSNDFFQQTEQTLQTRVQAFDEVLRAGAGLFTSSSEVTKNDWREFVEATRVLERYTGSQGIGYSKLIDSSDLEDFNRNSQTDITADFTIHPEDNRDTYSAILYIEPQSTRNKQVIGYDMFSEEVRRAAMEEARDNGNVVISDAVRLAQEDGSDMHGFLMYVPQYRANTPLDTREQRREALEGWVFAVFQGRGFLTNVLSEIQNENFGYRISKPSSNGNVELYTSNHFKPIHDDAGVLVDRQVDIKNSVWKFEYTYRPDAIVGSLVANQPITILFFGTFSALLISGFTYLLLRGKTNELALAKERETNEAKDNLLSIASHQLRTPATGVKQYSGMVLQGFAGDITEQQRVLLEKAYESNERQLKTINDVLYLARLDSGRIVLTKSRIELQELIHSVVEEQKERIDENQHKIKFDFPKKKVYVHADEHMLRMAIENLISNAVKYTKRKGKIAVSIQRKKSEVQIAVQDSGVGISSEDLNTLFQQFSRIPNELSKSVSGTGIGLYLARHLLMLHGGDIEVSSEKGVGSTFTIHLPVDSEQKNSVKIFTPKKL